ncbi:cytochrome c biogenesis protein ResB [Jeotgalibacillus salarius]|uniref:Cytochrome C biogenesis protein n=1 Tax=Jeotgalibacillus salarius TaxID=546023 RepID=A0A4Y8LJC6_9BACL|nr:cytochrome c biogenesis protein ResB [Jeotgalibacillus salarius]TFE03120.1 cytochrome C biogenesis protein [Jeotgalibacillus salarius]
MSKIICQCGHENPEGSELCQACGRTLTEAAAKRKTHDVMRYEGMARRSQTYHSSIIDKIWNFFSSVKVGVTLIFITLVASAIGTIFPQEFFIPQNIPAVEYYESRYGIAGKIYYVLGFHDLYGSWWFMLLVAAIGTSIIIASLDRGIPLYKALKKQRVERHDSFLKRQRIYTAYEGNASDDVIERIGEGLRKRRYKVKAENGHLLAEKNRFSRWGPYINHVGLIIFLIGAMLRFVPGMYVDEILWIREGETRSIPGTEQEYFLKNDGFTLETYQEGDSEVFDQTIQRTGAIAKNFQTDAILYKRDENAVAGSQDELTEVDHHAIQVNVPMKFDQFALYQTDYIENELYKMNFTMDNKETGEPVGAFTVDLFNPETSGVYELEEGYSVELTGYYPDFSGFEDGEPQSDSPLPNNPAFLFNMVSPEHPDGEVAFVAIQQNLEPLGPNEYEISFNGIETRDLSGLTVRKDLTLWILALGGAIFMFGVVIGAYWNHRRVWIKKGPDSILYAAGHTNKNWYGLKKDIAPAFEYAGLDQPMDHQELKESDSSAKEEEESGTTRQHK